MVRRIDMEARRDVAGSARMLVRESANPERKDSVRRCRGAWNSKVEFGEVAEEVLCSNGSET